MVTKSWDSNEALEYLAEVKRSGEVIEGVVQSSRVMALPVRQQSGKYESIEQETLIVQLPGGVKGYCPASEFREREHRSHIQFISQKESFVITDLDLTNKMAMLSANKAAKIQSTVFWDNIVAANEQGSLDTVVFEGIVTGYKNPVIYVRVDGQDCYMYREEWSWEERGVVDPMQGEKILVKVTKFDREQGIVRVSRKQATQDPWETYSKQNNLNDLVAGRVERVDPIHGVFVRLEEGVEVKASKRGELPDPIAGDYVSCRLSQLDVEKRRGRVVILGYPRGKRKTKDFGSFLFE